MTKQLTMINQDNCWILNNDKQDKQNQKTNNNDKPR